MNIFTKYGARNKGIDEGEFEKLLSDVQREVAIEVDKIYQERLRLIDIKISEVNTARLAEVAQLAVTCADELGQHEHNFHHTMELRGIEIAKLDAKIEALKEMEGNDARCYKEIIKNKDAEIEYLKKLIDKMVDKAAHIDEVKLTHTYKNYPSYGGMHTLTNNGGLPSFNNN